MLFGYVSMINQVFLPLSTPHKALYVTFGRKKNPAGEYPGGAWQLVLITPGYVNCGRPLTFGCNRMAA